MFIFFFFNDTATTEIYTLSLHDALPISGREIVCGPVPVITGASLSGSRLPAPTFSIMTSLLSSQSGCSQPLAVLVLPRILSVHVTFLSTPQSFGTTTLKTNQCRRGEKWVRLSPSPPSTVIIRP